MRMPIPPIQWVDDLQNNKPGGRASMLVKMVEPVVVYPDTLSNQALVNVNSPPHRMYGSIPTKQESSQLLTTMTKPSLLVISVVGGTKIMGKTPKRATTMKL
jgi:hypothetical protein